MGLVAYVSGPEAEGLLWDATTTTVQSIKTFNTSPLSKKEKIIIRHRL